MPARTTLPTTAWASRLGTTSRDSLGIARPEHAVYVWIEVYEKQGDDWKLMVVASTDRPGTPADTAAT